MLLILPFTGWAQDDDVYFVPKKKAQKTQIEQRAQPSERYLPVEIVYEDENVDDATITTAGSKRDVDEYNRRGPRGTQLKGEMVQNPDGTFSYRVPASDTLYVMNDSTAITTDGLASELYARGYEDGIADGEEYAYSQRIGRFGYGGVYSSPWYYSYYDPFYWDDWYYHPYHGYYGLYHWGRPYWGYGYYNPYWYGGYYGWGYPYYSHHYYGGNYGRGRNTYGGRGGTVRGGRAGNYSTGGRTSRSIGNIGGGRASSNLNSGRSGSQMGIQSRTSDVFNGGGRASGTISTPSTSRSSGSTISSSSSRSSGTFSGGGSSSGSFGGRSGGGGFSGGGGSSRGGGGGGGRGGR